MITYILKDNEPLTNEERIILEEAKNKPVVYDEDCPEMTAEMLSKFTRKPSLGVAIKKANIISARNGNSEMNLTEIDKEIAKVRKIRKEQ